MNCDIGSCEEVQHSEILNTFQYFHNADEAFEEENTLDHSLVPQSPEQVVQVPPKQLQKQQLFYNILGNRKGYNAPLIVKKLIKRLYIVICRQIIILQTQL